MTDSIVLALLVFFFVRGWCGGLLRTLGGPLSLLLACLTALIYHAWAHNLLVTIAIVVLGPLLLNILFSFALNVWNRTASVNKTLSVRSRVLGGGLSLLWNGIYVLLFLAVIAIFPVNAPGLSKIREDVFGSRTYSLMAGLVNRFTPAKPVDLRRIPQALQDPTQQERIQSLDEYKAVMEDETLQKILTDKEIVEAAQNKDIAKLMANPKMREIFSDKKALQKILDLNLKIMEQQNAGDAAGANPTEEMPPH